MINASIRYKDKYDDISIIFNIKTIEEIDNYHIYFDESIYDSVKVYFNLDEKVFTIENNVKNYVNSIYDFQSEFVILINNIQSLKYIIKDFNYIKSEIKQRALNNILIKKGQDINQYYNIDNIGELIKDIPLIDVIIRKSYLINNEFMLNEVEDWKSKIIIEDILKNHFTYVYNINHYIDALNIEYEYLYLLKNILNILAINVEYLRLFNDKVFVGLFNKICSVLGKLGSDFSIQIFISIIIKYKKLLLRYNLNIIDKSVEKFIVKLEEEPIDNIKTLMWYQFYIKSIYKSRIYDIRENEKEITYYCVIHTEMRRECDNELLEDIEFYLKSSINNHRIYLKKEYGDTSFYKDDYPHKKYINNKDNFILTLYKDELMPGEYELTYDFMGKEGKVILSNFALARKLEDKIIKRKNDTILMKYTYSGKEVGINIELCNTFISIKKKYELIKEDIKRIKESKQNKAYIFFIYFMYKVIKKIYNKKIVLVGETHNTYQDSGKVVFESLKNDRDLRCYYVTSNQELLKRDKKYIEFMSIKHKIIYLLADALLNVQNIDIYMSPFINRNKDLVYKRHSKDYLMYKAFSRYLKNQKKVFLQHGVLYQAGLTNAVYINCDFDYFIVSTEFEKNIFPKSCRVAIESCLPRFSTYEKNSLNQERIVLFSPTWRKYLKDLKNGKIYEDLIRESEYYQRIKSLLNNKKLHKILEKYDYKLIYNIHHTLTDLGVDDLLYKDCKNIIINRGEYNLNELISKSIICITDYSSLFFDFLWQNKCVLHYIYDYEEFHNRTDNNKKKSRYFDLKKYNNIYCEEDLLIDDIGKNIQIKAYNTKTQFLCKGEPCEEFIKYIKKILLFENNNILHS